MNAILLIVNWLHPIYKLAERSAWVNSLTEIEKIDDLPHWLATNAPSETHRALHILLETITVSTETIELKFKS
ncbi:MAG: hypothetical protein M3R47_18680 [Chloroflexota bacterium]|nr:hypothetical protein [Chloroflexota bacterium]